MDEDRFQRLKHHAMYLTGRYGIGYRDGLRRLYLSTKYLWDDYSKMGHAVDMLNRGEFGRGYRDGFAGVDVILPGDTTP